ncbi:glycosyltransferase [Haliovirga abyssi]|nr:glycosyltransferase [Haliovirga abyssi]
MFLYFLIVVFFISSGVYKKRYIRNMASKNVYSEKISIIIPAKDEENNIETILTSCLNQNYSKELYEVVLINDRSKDKTLELAKKFEKEFKNLKIITIKKKESNLYGKQNALDVGIKNATGDLILITDADCKINKNWVRRMSKYFAGKDLGMVIGKTEITHMQNPNFLYRLQTVAHRFLMEIAQVPIMFGYYTSGIGNNLAFRKNAYIKIGGYENLGESILDDEILIRGFARKGYKLAAGFTKNSIVETNPMKSYKELFNQHKRWIVGSLNIFTPSGLLVFVQYFFNIYTIYSLFTGDKSVIFKLIGDYLLYSKLDIENGRILRIVDKIAIVFFVPFYITALGTAAIINPKTNWKEQKYKKKILKK